MALEGDTSTRFILLSPMRKFLVLFPVLIGLISAPDSALANRHVSAPTTGHFFSRPSRPPRRVIYVDRQGRRSYWKGPRRVYFGPRFFHWPFTRHTTHPHHSSHRGH